VQWAGTIDGISDLEIIEPLLHSIRTSTVPYSAALSVLPPKGPAAGNSPRVIDHGLHPLPNGVISAGTKESQEFAIETKVLPGKDEACVETFFLYRRKIKLCTACDRCQTGLEQRCVVPDDRQEL
jgi:hypothetical protein